MSEVEGSEVSVNLSDGHVTLQPWGRSDAPFMATAIVDDEIRALGAHCALVLGAGGISIGVPEVTIFRDRVDPGQVTGIQVRGVDLNLTTVTATE
ncbi:hypothetical protein [Nocardioides sp. AX2bis]|uniref:hypothetical protein n=1 Tax=Nocardioides sp. AX2bis TaxID=2653157 RepID=UPI0012F2A297|nr:hypothetical protein [Nocardioides sp. AX2bis]VXC37551.1 hypothetical protein NOCARDAX2BIS_520142 [Nocardioides sp. AX2bis]